MIKIFSKKQPSLLMHTIVRQDESSHRDRLDVSPEEEFLQLAVLRMPEGKTFRPHKHIVHEKTTNIAQESWVVIKGLVEVTFYDIDDTILDKVILNPGDVSITYRGGHNYKILSDDTLVYVFKTGPYLGQQYDKVFIGEA